MLCYHYNHLPTIRELFHLDYETLETAFQIEKNACVLITHYILVCAINDE